MKSRIVQNTLLPQLSISTNTTLISIAASLLCLSGWLIQPGSVLATDGTWTNSSGNWSDTTRWIGGTVAAGQGATATINLGSSGNLKLTNDTARTVGTIQLSNSGGQSFDIYGNSTTLTFDVAAGLPLFGFNSYYSKSYTIGAGGLTIAGTKGLKVEVGSNTVRPVSGLSWTGFSGTLEIDCNGGTGGWDPQAASLMPSTTLSLANESGTVIFGMYAGRNQTIDGLNGTVRAYLNNNYPAGGNGTLTFGNNGGSGTFAGIIGGDNTTTNKGGVSIIKNGSGTQTISGWITGTNGTTETVTVNNGTLILSGNNSYQGITTVNSGGTLQIGNANALGSTTGITVVNSGGVLDLNGQTTPEQFGDTGSNDGLIGTGISGNGALINSSGTAAQITGAIYGNAAFTVGAGNITVNQVGRRNSGVNTVTLTKINSGTLTFGGNADNTTLVLAANGGTTVLAKNSTSTARVADSLTIGNGGTVQFNPSLGTSTGSSFPWAGQINATVTLNAGGILDLNGSSGQNSRFQQLVSTDFGGTITNSSSTAGVLGIAARNGNTYTFSGNIVDGVGGGTVALDFTTTGTFGSGRINVLAGNNTFSGPTTNAFGTLQLDNANALQNSTLYQNSSLAFSPSIGTFTLGGLSGSGNFALADTSSSAVTLNIGNNNFPTTHSGTISGSGAITKIGSGALTLSGPNTYSGGTTLSAGQLNINNGGSSSANSAIGTGTLTISGGTIDNTGSGDVTLQPNNTQNWNGDFTYAGTAHNLNFGTGGVTLGANRQVAVSANTLTVGGSIGDSGSGYSLTKTGNGTLTLSSANTFSGGLTNKAGTVSFSNANGLGTGKVTLGDATIGANATLLLTANVTATNNIVVATGAGARTISGNNSPTFSGNIGISNNLVLANSINALSGTFTGSGNITNGSSYVSFNGPSSPNWTGNLIIVAGTIAQGGQLNSNTVMSIASGASFNNNNANVTVAGVNDITGASGGSISGGYSTPVLTLRGAGNYGFSGVYSGVGGLNVSLVPGGSQTLTGTNTYTGNTTISAGMLALSGNGSISNSPTITIANGATFDVSAVTPGGYSLNGSGTLSLNINKTGSTLTQSLLALGTKNITYGGALTVSATGSALAAGDSFNLITTTGTRSGWFSSVSVPALASGISWDTNHLANTGVLNIYNFTTTPLAFSTPKNTTATIAALKLSNHASSANATATYPAGWTTTVTTAPTHGSASIDGSGNLVYTPTTGYSGSDSLTLTFQDGHGWQTMAVSVTVGNGNGTSPNVVSQGVVGSNYVVNFAGIPGYTYTVETNSVVNGPGWTKWGNITAASNGAMQVADPIGSGSVFYRTVYPSY